jgi:hypothetical protein
MESLKERVNLIMEKLNINKTEFAKLIDISPQNLRHFLENNKGFPNKYYDIFKSVGINPNYMIFGKGELFLLEFEKVREIANHKLNKNFNKNTNLSSEIKTMYEYDSIIEQINQLKNNIIEIKNEITEVKNEITYKDKVIVLLLDKIEKANNENK